MSSAGSDHGATQGAKATEWRETETRSPRFDGLETWSNQEILAALLGGQHQALNAVWGALPQIDAAVTAAVARLTNPSGRIFYVGAGTSGRLAVLDGVELTPTFGWPTERIVYLFAGGEAGYQLSREGAEDDEEQGRKVITDADAGPDDVVLALAASGTTPFTRAAVTAARKAGALTVSFANNPGAPLLEDAEIGVLLRSGPEVLSGSTRLGAGTSQKAALNLFSTATMIGLNKVYHGQMVDMQTSNQKLVQRAVDMVGEITGCSDEVARRALSESDNHVKLAVLLVDGLKKPEAVALLKLHNGNLRTALEVWNT